VNVNTRALESASPSALGSRLAGYMAERCPPRLTVVFVMSYSTALLFGKALTGDGALRLSLGDLAGGAGYLAFFVLARVFDEHKDFEFDVVHLSDRPLPRGAISWREVDGLGWAAAIVMIAVCLALDRGVGAVSLWWAVAMAYLFLTRFEFFIRPWLRRHFLTNTVTHLPVYALASIWAAQIGARPPSIGAGVIWLGLFMYVYTFGLDLWRKSHAPVDERQEVCSYTQRFGVRGASWATGVTLLASGELAMGMLSSAKALTSAPAVTLVAVVVPLLVSLVRFARTPNRATHTTRRNLLMSTLLAQELIVILTLAVSRGLGSA
jgi:4-hydroxybenzoate polyprenyltransferase